MPIICKDFVPLYHLANLLRFEFATAAMHNNYYFHKFDNKFEDQKMLVGEFEKVIQELLKSSRVKDWYRAYFNYGLANYVLGNKRLLPCEMGFSSFFVDPFGDLRPCNGMDEVMGNIKEQSFEEIWTGAKSKDCEMNCWMIGSVAEMMKKHISVPTKWIVRTKLLKKPIEYCGD
ncbi:MAG: SPASM domain-containing protein [Pseudomonadota bacterium]